MGRRMVPALSPFHSAEPCKRRMNPPTSSNTVPRRSDGMRPRGPSTRPRRGVIARMSSGVQRNTVAWCFPLTICAQYFRHGQVRVTDRATHTIDELWPANNIRARTTSILRRAALCKHENLVLACRLRLTRQVEAPLRYRHAASHGSLYC